MIPYFAIKTKKNVINNLVTTLIWLALILNITFDFYFCFCFHFKNFKILSLFFSLRISPSHHRLLSSCHELNAFIQISIYYSIHYLVAHAISISFVFVILFREDSTLRVKKKFFSRLPKTKLQIYNKNVELANTCRPPQRLRFCGR